jgi:N-acetylmuramoyl-L-alanine amidase
MSERIAPVVLMAGIAVASAVVGSIASIMHPANAETVSAQEIESTERAEKEAAAFRAQEVVCLAENIYHEARGEHHRGMVAVGYVTMNRVAEHFRGGDTICKVVWAHAQFSWTEDKSLWKVDDRKAWAESLEVAMDVYAHRLHDPTRGADHYHTTAVHPYWTDVGADKRVIGNHLFMKL